MRNLLAFIALIILTSCAPATAPATPTPAAARATAQVIGTQSPTLPPPTVAASNTPAPTNTVVPSATVAPSATPAPTNTPAPVAATVKPTETATDVPKVVSTATRSAGLAIVATETRVIAPVLQTGTVQARATATLAPAATATAGPVAVQDPNAGVGSVDGINCPASHPIKGNQGSRSTTTWIYHMPGQNSYKVTKPEACFATEDAARRAGYRRADK